jgi:ATP adenylyltransferase
MAAAHGPRETAPPPAAGGAIRPFAPGTLWTRLVACHARALASGALAPIATEESVIEDGGVRFRVHCVSSLARKAEAAAAAPVAGNPFLTPDPALFVADVSATHFALLNKFPVLAHHLLIVTRAFEEQERLLTAADFEALARTMAEFESLGFYNGGFAAGASQPHKHLQLVRLPLAPEGPAVPIEVLFEQAAQDAGADEIRTVAGLPFVHAFTRLDPLVFEEPTRAAAVMYARYQAMLPAAGLSALPAGDGSAPRQSAPYNLLATRRWMLLVPRAREHFEDISINALGFAGSFFVRDRAQRERLAQAGPFAALRAVAVTRRPAA